MDFLVGDWFTHLLKDYGYIVVFVVVMLESSGIPLPGETILISASAFAGHQHSLDIGQ